MKRENFRGLDTLRGIAAVTVALYHFLVYGPQVYIIKSGHLAVDFFFCLSGFVIGYAYEERLRTNLSVAQFALLRLIRFYPYYLLGLIFGIGAFAVYCGTHQDAIAQGVSWLYLSGVVTLHALFIPGPGVSQPSAGANFALNPPAWTLFLELGVNILYAAILRWLTTRNLAILIGIFGVALAVMVCANGNADLGYDHGTLLGGFLRCGFSFFAGVLLQRLRPHQTQLKFSPLWLVGAMVFLLWYLPHGIRPVYDLAVIMIASPLMVWLGSSPYHKPALTHPIWHMLGSTSYGLYAIHFPLMSALLFMYPVLSSPDHHIFSFFIGVLAVISVFILTLILDRNYDQPLRKYWMANRNALFQGNLVRKPALSKRV